MCVIAICKERKLTDDELHSCWQNNDDGAGMAWFEGENHIIEKGFMKYEEFKQRYESINIFPHVVHFRIATAGGKIPELTHPFICAKKSPTSIEWVGKEPVLFHNGVVTNWYAMADVLGIKVPDNYWSDTRVLASILTEEELDFLKEEGGKYAVLVGKEIITYGNFIEANGIQFSNSSYDGVWNVWSGAIMDYYDEWYKRQHYYKPISHNTKKEDICEGCEAFITIKDCKKYCWKAHQQGSYPHKVQSGTLTVVPDKESNPCNSCKVVSVTVCNTYCSERLKPGYQFKTELKKEQISLCDSCNSSGILCDSCSEKDKPNSKPSQRKKCPKCHKTIYYSTWCFFCGIDINTYLDPEQPINSKNEPFSGCEGRCENCPDYDPVHNNCKEVVRAMTEKENSLKLLEASLKVDEEECVNRGESCYTCPNFDPDGYRCMVW